MKFVIKINIFLIKSALIERKFKAKAFSLLLNTPIEPVFRHFKTLSHILLVNKCDGKIYFCLELRRPICLVF